MNPTQDDPRLGLPSASKLERVCECPGSVPLEKSLPPEAFCDPKADEEDSLADRGTRIHKARETGISNHLDPEEYRLYQAGLEYELKLLAQWKHSLCLGDVQEGPRELRLYLHDQRLAMIGSGQLDVHYISGEHGLIIDWKTGFCSNLTGAKGNWQLRMQAVLLWMDHPGLKHIRVGFAKPMFESNYLDFCDYEEFDLKNSYDSMVYHLWWSSQEDAWRRAGKHCRYCPARNGYCPEALAYAILPSVIAKNVWSKQDVAQSVNEVTHADLLKVWRMGPMIKNILEGVKTRLETLSEQELTDLGLELGPGRKTKDVTRMREAFIHLRDAAGWPEEQIWAVMRFVTKHMVTYLGNKGSDEKAAKAWVETTLKPFVTEKTGDKILRELKG